MLKYFSKCETSEDVKNTFKELAKKLHPDNGGDIEAFKEMMAEYTIIFNKLKNIHKSRAGQTYTATGDKRSHETPEEFAEIINSLIFMKGIKIEIAGSWIWVSGDTKPYKDELKKLHFWFSAKKKAWYYTGGTEMKHTRGHYSMKKIRNMWGAYEVTPENARAIADNSESKLIARA